MSDVQGFPPNLRRFGRIYLYTLADRRLSAMTKLVLAALWAFANGEGRCWPSQATIASIFGVSRQAIAAHIKVLIKFGYVSAERRVRPRAGGWAANAYTLHDPPLVNGDPVGDMATVQALALQR